MSDSVRVRRVSRSSQSTKFSNSSHCLQSVKNKPSNHLKRRSQSVCVIHKTIRLPTINQHSVDKKPVAFDNNLVSFSTILSARQGSHRQNLFTTQSIDQRLNDTNKSESVITDSSQHRSVVHPQINDWDNGTKQSDIPLSTFHIHSQKVDREQSLVRDYSLRTNKITTIPSLNRNEHPTILDETKKRKKQRKLPCVCSIPCALLSLLICFLLAGAIVATGVTLVIKSKATTTTISTTLSTTIIIPTLCSCLCTNEVWTFSSDLLARWSFDGIFDDVMGTYDATPNQSPTFVSNGYINQALVFNATALQSISAPYIPLAYTSFTVEAWLQPTGFPNPMDHSILGLCSSTSANLCLHLLIRTIASNHYLYFGFFNDDCQGNTSLILNQWIHVAFVFDMNALTQSIYLNGLLDNKCTVSAPFMGSLGDVTIGVVPAIIPLSNINFFQGYIDHMSITKHAKSSCEIREDATLAACFLFDATAPYTDSGPNSLLTNTMSSFIISSGHSSEAISFNGSSTSYFQASSFTGLGLTNKPFSIIFWLRPHSILTSTIVHISQTTLGTGWCVPFLGISTNGSLIAQVYSLGAVVAVYGPSIPLSPVWSHVVETWSQTNGLRLYINDVLVASDTSITVYTGSGVSDFVTLANSRSGYNYCSGLKPAIHAPGPFNGDIDDFRLYSRELTATEIHTIYIS